MNITHRASNFAQFSDDLWLVAEHDGTRIPFDVDQRELLQFASDMIDVAVDALRKSKADTDDIDTSLCNQMDKLAAALARHGSGTEAGEAKQ